MSHVMQVMSPISLNVQKDVIDAFSSMDFFPKSAVRAEEKKIGFIAHFFEITVS